MKKLAISTVIGLAMVFGCVSQPSLVLADSKKSAKKSGKPLRGVVRKYRRVGGYSYKYPQSIDTRDFIDPTMKNQTISGPFDSGFFFSSTVPGNGGDSPYMQ